MAAIVQRKERRLIPRWRTFTTAAALGELDNPASAHHPLPANDVFFTDRLSDWKKNKTLWHATDLIGAAVVYGRREESIEAANFVLSTNSRASHVARAAAAKIISPSEAEAEDYSVPEDSYRMADVYGHIHDLRHLSREYPLNPIIWMDLALAYTILGRHEQALRAIQVAVNLSPKNRFILRSAARFYVHQDDPERAFQILRASELSQHDPWLLAAEIAVGSAAGLSPRSIRPARAMLDDYGYSSAQTTELAGAIATLELDNGRHGPARKLFRKALLSPTENTVAQAEWASEHMRGLDVDVRSYKTPRLFEARAWEAFVRGDWADARDASFSWYSDQPFSSRPAELSSYLASTVFSDYVGAYRILKRGLVANPSDAILLNNLAFTYACQDRIEEAEETLARIKLADLSDPNHVTVLATRGLVNFRRRLEEKGRSLYLEAIEKAQKLSLRSHKAMAAIYLAREELLANTEHAPQAVRRAIEESKSVKDKDIQLFLERLKKLYREPRAPGALPE